MDKQIPAVVGLIDEAFKGNLRIRIHKLSTIGDPPTYLVDVSAWSAWGEQAKLLFAQGGIDLEDARGLLASLTEQLRWYDWHEDEVLWEDDY